MGLSRGYGNELSSGRSNSISNSRLLNKLGWPLHKLLPPDTLVDDQDVKLDGLEETR